MFSQYKSVIAYGLINKALIIFTGYISVIILNQILGKELFGELVFFQSVFSYVAIISILGFDKTIIYKLSGFTEDESVFFGRNLFTKFIRVSISATLFVEVVFVLLWFTIGKRSFSHENFWIIVFSINSYIIVINSLYEAYFQANKKASKTIIITNYISLIRLFILTFLFIFSRKDLQYMVVYVLLPSLINAIWFYAIERKTPEYINKIRVETSDYSYSLKMMFTKLSHVGIEKIDLIMIGLFLSATDIAEYAVAAKVAIIVRMGNDLLSPLLSPRLKYQIENGTPHDISQEYQYNRKFSLAVAIVGVTFFTYYGDVVLGIFGPYENSHNILCLLSLAFMNQVAFGPNGRYLALKGYSTITLLSSILMLFIMVIANVVLIDIYGAIGAATATFLSLLILNVLLQICISKIDKINFLGFPDYIFILFINLYFLYIFLF